MTLGGIDVGVGIEMPDVPPGMNAEEAGTNSESDDEQPDQR